MKLQAEAMQSKEILDTYFLENRARLLEIAAFLDRLERAPDSASGHSDFRHEAFLKGIRLLLGETGGGRTRAIQLSFSDPTTEPIASAVGLKATGAWDGGGNEGH